MITSREQITNAGEEEPLPTADGNVNLGNQSAQSERTFLKPLKIEPLRWMGMNAPAGKADNLCSITRTHTVEGENQLFDLHVCNNKFTSTHAHLNIHTDTVTKKK